jgi:BirA family biotin operon repressor/biotin-[acetyl-CoA-carboxylase] ligase
MNKIEQEKKTRILSVLSDGQFHSGEKLGAHLKISRTAISNHVSTLKNLGLDIFSVAGKGYKWANPTHLIDKVKISSYLSDSLNTQIHCHAIIDSTNTFVKQHKEQLNSGDVCVAETQTAGRGRQGKTWFSPFGANLYFSMYWRFSSGMQALSGLSLVVGITICELLKNEYAIIPQLKWPNDIYGNNKKLSGVLTEIEGQADGTCHCIIGIGINLAMDHAVTQIDQPWTDLQSLTQNTIDRNHLTAHLVQYLNDALTEFQHSSLSSFIEKWHQYDLYKDVAIKLIMGDKTLVSGIARGINDQGAILVESNGQIKPYFGGEISVRKG